MTVVVKTAIRERMNMMKFHDCLNHIIKGEYEIYNTRAESYLVIAFEDEEDATMFILKGIEQQFSATSWEHINEYPPAPLSQEAIETLLGAIEDES